LKAKKLSASPTVRLGALGEMVAVPFGDFSKFNNLLLSAVIVL